MNISMYLCISNTYACDIMYAVCVYICVCIFVYASVYVYIHTQVQITNITRFFSVSLMILYSMIWEPQKWNQPICASVWQILTKHNHSINFPVTLGSQCWKKNPSSDSLVFHCDKLQWFNIQPVLLRAGPHWQMNNRVQYSDSYWNICTSADPGIPFCLEGWQLLTGLINQNYADSFELDSFISPQNCTQWLERWQVTVILWVIKF